MDRVPTPSYWTPDYWLPSDDALDEAMEVKQELEEIIRGMERGEE